MKAHCEQQQNQHQELQVKEDAVKEMERQNAVHDELCSIIRGVQSYDSEVWERPCQD